MGFTLMKLKINPPFQNTHEHTWLIYATHKYLSKKKVTFVEKKKEKKNYFSWKASIVTWYPQCVLVNIICPFSVVKDTE